MTSRKPKLLLLAGVNGVGKTTLSMSIANFYKIKRVISTDLIREVLRSHIDLLECPELHRSSFSIGKHNHPVYDWEDCSIVLQKSIRSIIDKSRCSHKTIEKRRTISLLFMLHSSVRCSLIVLHLSP